MKNYTELKKELAERRARDICSKLGTVTSKYHMTGNLKDELLQIAGMVGELRHKINNI